MYICKIFQNYFIIINVYFIGFVMLNVCNSIFFFFFFFDIIKSVFESFPVSILYCQSKYTNISPSYIFSYIFELLHSNE